MKKILTVVASTLILLLTGCGETTSGDTYNVTSGGDTHIGDANTVLEEGVSEGIYREDYSQESCEAAGFFYCTIENQCLDIPLSGGSCNG